MPATGLLPQNLARRWLVDDAAQLVQCSSSTPTLAKLLPHMQPITVFRDRSVESRGLVLEVKESESQSHKSNQLHEHLHKEKTKAPSESYIKLTYPLSSSPALLAAICKPVASGKLHYDVALLLEDIDLFAADVAARHAELGPNRKLVTATVERILWFNHYHPSTFHAPAPAPPISAAPTSAATAAGGAFGGLPVAPLTTTTADFSTSYDLQMSGQVMWVGKSSMEVLLELTTCKRSGGQQQGGRGEQSAEGEQEGGDGWLVASARFLMASRDGTLKNSAAVPQLVPVTGAEQALLAAGESNHKTRQHRRKHIMQRQRAADESVLPPGAGTTRAGPALAPAAAGGAGAPQQQHVELQLAAARAQAGARPVRATHVTATYLTQHKDRNTTGTVFGGQLLRYGYEHAIAVANSHAGETCEMVVMQDVPFIALVPLGCMFHLTGSVVFTSGPLLHVVVRAERSDVLTSAPDHGKDHQDHKHKHAGKQHGHHTRDVHAHGQQQQEHHGHNSHNRAAHQQHHNQPVKQQTHVFYFTLRAVSGREVAPVAPESVQELHEYVHAQQQHEDIYGAAVASGTPKLRAAL